MSYLINEEDGINEDQDAKVVKPISVEDGVMYHEQVVKSINKIQDVGEYLQEIKNSEKTIAFIKQVRVCSSGVKPEIIYAHCRFKKELQRII